MFQAIPTKYLSYLEKNKTLKVKQFFTGKSIKATLIFPTVWTENNPHRGEDLKINRQDHGSQRKTMYKVSSSLFQSLGFSSKVLYSQRLK